MSQWVVLRDEALFSDAASFLPGRWLDRGRVTALPRFACFPFGGGPRGCIGRDLALMEAPLVLAALWQKVHCSVEGADPEPWPSVTLGMRRPLVLRVVDR